MKKTKVILIIIGVLVLCGGLVAGLLLVQQNENLARKAAPATTMYVSPASQSKTPGSTFTYTVSIDTNANAVTGVDIRMNYNPAAIQITSLQLGAGASNLNQTIANTYDNATGKLQFAVFTLNSSNAITGSRIEILKVNGTVKSGATAGNYTLAFDAATAASASQEGQNVLTGKTPGTLTVTTGTGPGPTATAAPTGNRTPTPTGNRTATPTAAGNRTATPTPVRTPTRTPTQAPAGNNRTATPTPTKTATATPAPTRTPTATPTATATAVVTAAPTATQTAMPIPVTGTDWPTLAAVAFGILIVFGSILLAL